MAAAVSPSIDDLFRHKPLAEIHAVLKQTRDEVEAKKTELRELVGDHYRSVLESSDHIRAMSECAAKVATGADRVEELIASMRQLAASPPHTGAAAGAPFRTATSRARAAALEEDDEYRVGERVMELLEVPDTVRTHLAAHAFVPAARAALLDAPALQSEVAALLAKGACGHGAAGGSPFDFAALLRQQAATFRGLPRQIVASCADAFDITALDPISVAQSFVVHLLLEPSVQPVPLLRVFMARRTEVLKRLLDVGASRPRAPQDAGAALGCRLASAAMAFEGTIVLSSCLCKAAPGSEPAMLRNALASLLEGALAMSPAEERAAIEGRTLDSGPANFRRRVDAAGALLRQASSGSVAMGTELARLGGAFVSEWAGGRGSSQGLASLFGRILSGAGESGPRTCEALGGVLVYSSEKVLAYRRTLAAGAAETWEATWATSCSHFCPASAPPGDALVAIVATVEAACAEVIRERVNELQLELAGSDEGGSPGGEAGDSAAVGGSTQRREEIREVREQSASRVAQFDEQLGEVVADLQHVARGSTVPSLVTAALLDALADHLGRACDAVKLPPVRPLWPAAAATEPASAAAPSQRSAARAAIALDTLLSAVEGRSLGAADAGPSQLRTCLQAAASSGDARIAEQARAIEDRVRSCSADAFLAWARLAVAPDASTTAQLAAFWRLANDEVPPGCGWSSAIFASKGAQDQGAAKSIPVPVQASPFVANRLTHGARCAAEMCGSSTAPASLILAVKAALSEALMLVYEAALPQLPSPGSLKRTGMCHYVQWLFDLSFLRIALSAAAPSSGLGAPGATPSPPAPGRAAYEALVALKDKTEAAALSDPVDRTLYQPVLKATVKLHVQEVRILLGPLFLHNSLYGVLFASKGAVGATPSGGEGFEIQQAAFALPIRPALARFPLLPVATASSLAHAFASSAELDARLGLSAGSAGSAERAAARAAAASAANIGAGAAVSKMTQQVGSALGSLGLGSSGGLGAGLGGLGKAWPASTWATGWGAAGVGAAR